MKMKFVMLSGFLLLVAALQAQDKYFTKTGRISFFSEAPLEDIEAINHTAAAVLDAKSGVVAFSVLMKGFEFDKALMQEHFNENYVDSDQFPKGEFRGNITNNGEINYGKEGSYAARVKGKLTIHGVTRDIETTGTVRVEKDGLRSISSFNIRLSDYNVRIPSLVKDKISNVVKISVDCRMEALKEP
jgi:polyisoprenoid-binding protein YceI